ncbi:hypothetical protein [Merismopedia glauca]|uniref:Uncharacterized protein n=1 Tax=Merismopedia glauca CCAP 1448/3 TaxID=1296344 RepID=A0A2T1BWU6_9CYAN|nr:hypothetical protein [Merismopedia glauca]PSB00486.1 hypothetical protein C7B64_23275 [Merismopedia glauca CCAP 1448/3]
MPKLIALTLILCACNWKYEIVLCQPRQCHAGGKYTIVFIDPKGQKYSLDNCRMHLPTKKAATAWAREFKLEPHKVLEDGTKPSDCLKLIN